MALSDVQIANLALVRIGETIQVQDITTPEATKAGIAIKAVFTAMRDEVLEAADWPFAGRYAVLSLVKEADTDISEPWMYDWQYEYAWPSDCLMPRRLVDPRGRDGQQRHRIPYKLGGSGPNQLIFTNQTDAALEYTVKITSPAAYSATFASCLADRIGAEIAPGLTRLTGRAKELMVDYHAKLAAAASIYWNAQADGPPIEAEAVTARGIETDDEDTLRLSV